jgi:spore maturation protein CgeB
MVTNKFFIYLSLLLKCFYQTTKIRFNLFFYKLLNFKTNQISELSKKLKSRNFSWKFKNKTKYFLILSINNWESSLIESFKENTECYHFSWTNVTNFFKNKKDWNVFHTNLNHDICNSFDEFYDESSNIVIFFYASDFSVSPETVEYLKRKNTLLVSFCWDDLLYFKHSVKNQPVGVSVLSKHVDINLTLSPETTPIYNYYKSFCIFWGSQKLEKIIYNKTITTIYDKNTFYVLFVGSKYGWREDFINKLRICNIEVRCYGNGWENGTLTNEELVEKIQKAPLTIGFSNVGYTKSVTTIKGRDFEIPLWGGLYLTQYSKGIENYFKINDEILTYKNFNGCLKKILFIKNNPQISNKIRELGYLRALEYASWNSRVLFLKNLINEITYEFTN